MISLVWKVQMTNDNVQLPDVVKHCHNIYICVVCSMWSVYIIWRAQVLKPRSQHCIYVPFFGVDFIWRDNRYLENGKILEYEAYLLMFSSMLYSNLVPSCTKQVTSLARIITVITHMGLSWIFAISSDWTVTFSRVWRHLRLRLRLSL